MLYGLLSSAVGTLPDALNSVVDVTQYVAPVAPVLSPCKVLEIKAPDAYELVICILSPRNSPIMFLKKLL